MIYLVKEGDVLNPGLNILRSFSELSTKRVTVDFGFLNGRSYSTVTIKSFRLFLTWPQIKKHGKWWETSKKQFVYFEED